MEYDRSSFVSQVAETAVYMGLGMSPVIEKAGMPGLGTIDNMVALSRWACKLESLYIALPEEVLDTVSFWDRYSLTSTGRGERQMKIKTLRSALWSLVPFLEGKKDLPLRHVAVLLFVLERGETNSPEIQQTFSVAQGAASRIITDLKGLGLVQTYRGLSRADTVAPTEEGTALATTLEDIK